MIIPRLNRFYKVVEDRIKGGLVVYDGPAISSDRIGKYGP